MESVDLSRIAGWSAVLIGLIIVFAVVAFVVRRRALRDDTRTTAGGFEMIEIAKLREHGQLTDEEYRALRSSAARLWSDRVEN